MSPVKAWVGAAATLGVLMLLQALPGFIGAQLGAVVGGGGF